MDISVWERESFYGHKQVIIVGAGLAGLWSALELYNYDNTLKILLLDKGIIPTGASTRNAGFACFGSPTELLHDAEILGEDEMWKIAEMRYRGLEKIRKIFTDEAICFDNCGGYELLDDGYEGINELDEKLAWLNQGLAKITGNGGMFARNDKLLNRFKFNSFTHIIENKLEGGLHSGKLVQQLTKKVLALGIEIMTSTGVTGWGKNGNGIELNTNNGLLLTCDKLLICSNAMTSNLIKSTTITPARGQIIVTSPFPGLPFTGTFHFDSGYYYFRNLGNRVLLGGARNKAFAEEATNSLETTGIIQCELEEFLRERILPGQPFTIDYRWSGTMGFTENRLPLAEEIGPNVYVLVTCNGMGVALAPVMAEKMPPLMFG